LPQCERSDPAESIDEMVDGSGLPGRAPATSLWLRWFCGAKKGTTAKLISRLVAEGFARVRINGGVQ